MIVTIVLGVFAVIFAFLAKYKNIKYGLEISFSLIFLFLAFRYNFGNDYKSYYTDFIEITRTQKIDFYYGTYQRTIEPGWIILCRLFKPLGFYSLIAFISLIFCIVYYYLIKTYVPKNYYWLSVFIFIFNPSFLLIQLSAIRQSFAVILIIISYQYIIRRKFLLFIIFVSSASLFHASALIFLPAYLLGNSKVRINNLSAAVIILLFIFFSLYGNQSIPFFAEFIIKNFDRYNFYIIDEEINYGSGLGLIYYIVLLIFTLYIGKYQKNENSIMCNISIISFIVISLGLIINMAGRLNYYFQPALLVVLPVIINYIKYKPIKVTLMLMILAFSLRTFYSFFNNSIWHNAYISYKTIFSLI